MSNKTDKLAAAAKLATEKADKDVKAAADKLAAAQAAEAADALVSPADKALERAFVRGRLPESDRRAGELIPDGSSESFGLIRDGGNEAVSPRTRSFASAPVGPPPNQPIQGGSPIPAVATVASSAPPSVPPGGPPRTGEPVVHVVDRDFITTVPGTSLPDPIPAPISAPVAITTAESREAATPAIPQIPLVIQPAEPALPPSVVTPQPIVPRSEHAQLTAEDAVEFQRVPNDAINSVFVRADGAKVDSLGHIFPAAEVPAIRAPLSRADAVTQAPNAVTGAMEYFTASGEQIL